MKQNQNSEKKVKSTKPASARDRMNAVKKRQEERKKSATIYTKKREDREQEIRETEDARNTDTESTTVSETAENRIPEHSEKKKPKRSRQTATIVIRPDLKEFMREYCFRHRVVFSDLIEDLILELQREEEEMSK